MTRRTLRIAAGVVVALVLLGAGCKQPSGQRLFAYIDEHKRPSVFDLSSRRVIWQSKWPAYNGQVGICWSHDGSRLLYPCIDPEKNQFLGVLDVDSLESKYVPIPPEVLIWDMNSCDWSPSRTLVAYRGTGYPQLPVTIIDLVNLRMVKEFASTGGHVVWSPDEKKVAYAVWRGPADPFIFHNEIMVLDLKTKDTSMVFKGEQGYSVIPVKWSDDGAVVFKYLNRDREMVKDTLGRSYENVDEYYRTPEPAERPAEALYREFKSITGWDKAPSGDWLISGSKQWEESIIYLAPSGATKLRKLMPGQQPLWRPAPIKQ